MLKVYVSPGDPFGVGPEILLKALSKLKKLKFSIIVGSDSYFFKKKAKEFGINLSNKSIFFEDIYRIRKKEKNCASIEGAKFSIESLNWVIEKVKKQKGVIITGPVSKEAIRKIVPTFVGQTEYLCEKIGIERKKALMSFYFRGKFIGLFTQHIPLREVFNYINKDLYLERLSIFKKEIKKLIKKNPKIALLSINPHGEEFGEEERELKKYLKFGKNLKGFFPSDSFFGYSVYKDFDGIFAFYHDQATTAAKLLGPSIQITLGLPFKRLSPDHGPAYSMKGKSNFSSMVECFKFIEKYFIS
ncbi:MAG: 4-hydroxythreonine-4-phosphate dehydrogenase PdxA [Candidatus Hydrothermales bacterium]